MTPAIRRFERYLMVSTWLLAGCAIAGIGAAVALDEGTVARHGAAVVSALVGVASLVVAVLAMGRDHRDTHRRRAGILGICAHAGCVAAVMLSIVGGPSGLLVALAVAPAAVHQLLAQHRLLHESSLGGALSPGTARREWVIGLSLMVGWPSLVLVNRTSAEHDRRFDPATAQADDPSNSTVETIQGAQAPLHVTAFLSPGERASEVVTAYLTHLEQQVGDNLVISVVDFDEAREDARRTMIRGNGSLAFELEGRVARLELGDGPRDWDVAVKQLDARFNATLLDVIVPPRIAYYTAGHRERSLDSDDPDDYSALFEALGDHDLKVRAASTADGLIAGVPEDADLLIVADPQDPFHDIEVEVILDYVENGGALMLILDPDSEAHKSFKPLLQHLGISFIPRPMTHLTKHVRDRGTNADRQLLVTDLYRLHPITREPMTRDTKPTTYFDRAGGFLIDKDAAQRASLLVRSFPGTWGDADDDLEFDTRSEMRGSYRLAVAIEEGDTNEGRVVLFADGDALANRLFETGGGNRALGIRSVRWATHTLNLVDTAELRAPEDTPVKLAHADDRWWFAISVLMLPSVIVLLGFGRHTYRRRQRPTSNVSQ